MRDVVLHVARTIANILGARKCVRVGAHDLNSGCRKSWKQSNHRLALIQSADREFNGYLPCPTTFTGSSVTNGLRITLGRHGATVKNSAVSLRNSTRAHFCTCEAYVSVPRSNNKSRARHIVILIFRLLSDLLGLLRSRFSTLSLSSLSRCELNSLSRTASAKVFRPLGSFLSSSGSMKR